MGIQAIGTTGNRQVMAAMEIWGASQQRLDPKDPADIRLFK